MNKKIKALILTGVKQVGSYDPDEALFEVGEFMNNMEYTLASMFLRWATVHKKTFGRKNFEKVYNEFKKTN